MKKFALFALSAVMALPAVSQQTKILTAEKFNEYGLVYSLPTTALQVTVTARKVTKTPGRFVQYAKRYLGKTDVVAESSVSWTITDIKVVPYGVKAEDTQYLMQLKPGATTFIGVASDGMLLSINAQPLPDQAGLNGSVAPEGKMISSTGGVDDFLKYVDMDYLSAQNSMKQAEMVANSLMDVRESYLALTRGTADNVPTDGRQLELMLSSLQEQEGALTRAFEGSVTVEEFTSQYSYIPMGEEEEVLFRMSDFAGLVAPDDYSGSPVYIKTEVVAEGTLPVDANGEPKKFPKDGVVYGIPGSAVISIHTANKNLFSKEMEFSQFGTTFGLAPTLFTDKKAPSYARFSPVTGALVEIGPVAVPEEKPATAE